MTLFAVFLTYLASALVLPFPNWTSFRIAFYSVITAENVSLQQRLSMLRYLLTEIALLPAWAFFWVADEILFSSYHDQKLREPIFIFSQPRSGTTLLLRTLSEDRESFLSVQHLECGIPMSRSGISFGFSVCVAGWNGGAIGPIQNWGGPAETFIRMFLVTMKNSEFFSKNVFTIITSFFGVSRSNAFSTGSPASTT